MTQYAVATVSDDEGTTTALVVGDQIYPLPGRPAMSELLVDWDASLKRFDDHVRAGDLRSSGSVQDADLLPPVPNPPNVYCAGSNYSDHTREMRNIPPDQEVPKPPEGPFMFLKPTTTLIGHRDVIKLGKGCKQVDWELELAAVIGRAAFEVREEDALDYVAGYTIANDISVRDRFVRGEESGASMQYDWFLQKGWATACPLGPWLVPAGQVPKIHDAAMRLTRNGKTEQDSLTSLMIFNLREQIAYASSVVELVPGDVILTGTCAGVGKGKGQFLAAGDVVVCEIDGLGRLENPVEGA